MSLSTAMSSQRQFTEYVSRSIIRIIIIRIGMIEEDGRGSGHGLTSGLTSGGRMSRNGVITLGGHVEAAHGEEGVIVH